MEFNFDNSTKSTKSNSKSKTETRKNTVELTDNVSENLENTQKTEDVKPAYVGSRKAILVYIGNGVWKDSIGDHWSRTDKPNARILSTRSYDEEEYNKRDDLKFMVKYGEMRMSLA